MHSSFSFRSLLEVSVTCNNSRVWQQKRKWVREGERRVTGVRERSERDPSDLPPHAPPPLAWLTQIEPRFAPTSHQPPPAPCLPLPYTVPHAALFQLTLHTQSPIVCNLLPHRFLMYSHQGWIQAYVLVLGLKYRLSCTCTCTWSSKCYLYLYLDPKYLKNTKNIQVQTNTLYLIKSHILYINSSELCEDTIG